MGLRSPSYTQAPNELFDEWLPKLKLVELRVFLVIIRKTFGWHKDIDRISLSQLEKLTGSRKEDIVSATKTLEKMNLVRKTVCGEIGNQNTYYELIVEEASSNLYPSESPTGYRSEIPTPPGRKFRPTKETIPKETKRNRERERGKPPSPPPPHQSTHTWRFGNVHMNLTVHEELIKKYGAAVVQEYVERLEDYAGTSPKKFKGYADHAAVIRTWIRRDGRGTKPEDLPLNFGQLVPIKPHQNPNLTWAEEVISEATRVCASGETITIESAGIMFAKGTWTKFIAFAENGFKEQVLSQLRKMGIIINKKT